MSASALKQLLLGLKARVDVARSRAVRDETWFPDSSNLDHADYNPAANEMTVTFKSGDKYTYTGVPAHVYYQMKSAPSAGSYFHRAVRNRYSFRKH